MKKLSNVDTDTFRKFLEKVGCKMIRTKGDHEIWSRADLLRPIVFQSGKKVIPEFIVKNNLRILDIDKERFWDILEK
jgi:predicted RNA binding protein YcfA (HicA-like mRNA interferase family)